MKLGSLVLSFLALTSAGWLESASLADSHGKFPGKGSIEAYNRALVPMNKGTKKYYEKDFESAIRFANEAIAIYPFDSATHNNLGNALRRAGRLDEAIPEFKKAIELEPKILSSWLGLGLTYEGQHKLSDAERCYRKGVEINPLSYGALFDVGDILRQQGKLTEARAWLMKAKSRAEDQNDSTEVENALKLCEQPSNANIKEASYGK